MEIVIDKKPLIKCVLGDESGVVTGMFPPNTLFKRGAVLEFHGLRAYLWRLHIHLRPMIPASDYVFPSDKQIENVRSTLNISGREWYDGEW